MPTLTDQQIYQYRTNGFVNGGPLISESSADELAQCIDKVIHRNDLSNSPKPDILRNLSSTEEQPIWQIVNIWKASSLFAKLLEISELKEMAETLTGKHHFTDEKMMESLLKKEGVIIKNNKIENFENIFWDPIKELEL